MVCWGGIYEGLYSDFYVGVIIFHLIEGKLNTCMFNSISVCLAPTCVYSGGGMRNNAFTFSFLISLTTFLLKFQFRSCHLKDMGAMRVNLKEWMKTFEDRILGGENTTIEKYPFMVQFFNFGGLCSGSILTRKTVLTAAHCFDHNTNIAEMKIISSMYIFI